MPTSTAVRSVSVSGPGIDKSGYPSVGAALSSAITFAERSVGDATFYIRDHDGDVAARVEHDQTGTRVYRLTQEVAR